jgi:peptide deformylase
MKSKSQRILQIGNPVLREKATEINVSEIKSEKIQKLIASMIETIHAQEGVGLAAPQMGKSVRLIIIENGKGTSRRKREADFFPLTILINPSITASSNKLDVDWEGCLSIDKGDLLGLVPRQTTVTVVALNEKGKKISIKAKGFQARVLQHEIDHLDGILFFDRMRKKDLASLTTRYYWEKYYNE